MASYCVLPTYPARSDYGCLRTLSREQEAGGSVVVPMRQRLIRRERSGPLWWQAGLRSLVWHSKRFLRQITRDRLSPAIRSSARSTSRQSTFSTFIEADLLPRLLNQLGNKRGPSSLMTGSDTSTIITMKILVEKNGVSPEKIFLECVCASIDRTSAGFVAEENMSQPARQFGSHLV